jgi:hypothetical protein
MFKHIVAFAVAGVVALGILAREFPANLVP